MKTAPSSAKTNGIQWMVARSPCASAVPTSTGVTAAASVFGRAARSQGVIAVPQKSPASPPARRRDAAGPAGEDASVPSRYVDAIRQTPSRESRELLEVRLPLIHICVPPFLRLLGQVIEQGGVAAEIEQSELAVAVGVHGRFQKAQRHRRKGQHLAAPFQRLAFQLVQRDDGVDESHIERLLRVVLAAEEP